MNAIEFFRLGGHVVVVDFETAVAKLLQGSGATSTNLQRFFQDWQHSSAADSAPFCRYWVLALREYNDSDGERRFNVRPVSILPDEVPEHLPPVSLEGAELANAMHDYDHWLGYPFAWFFTMLSCKAANFRLAEAVLRDQMGSYDYLPAQDLAVLRQWAEMPYAV